MTATRTGDPAPGFDAAAEPSDGRPMRCIWCGSPLGGEAIRLGGRTACRHCGAATTDPWPTEAELEAAYGNWYRPKEEEWSEANAGGRRFAFGGDAVLGRTRALLAGRLDEIAPPGPILDVGAGEGSLVDAIASRGREVTGLERGAARSDFEDLAIEQVSGDRDWSGIVLWHALEHLPRPGAAIREAARLLRPGGVLVVAVPNASSLQARAFGDEWLHLDLPRHLVHLPAGTLMAGLRKAGFDVERVSHARGGQIVVGWLDGLVGLVPGLDLYAAIRVPAARSERISPLARALSVVAGVALLPVAAAAAAVEIVARRGGTVYVEARRR